MNVECWWQNDSKKTSISAFALWVVDTVDNVFGLVSSASLVPANRNYNQSEEQCATGTAHSDEETTAEGFGTGSRCGCTGENICSCSARCRTKESGVESVLWNEELGCLTYGLNIVVIDKYSVVVCKESAAKYRLIVASQWRIKSSHKQTASWWPGWINERSCEGWKWNNQISTRRLGECNLETEIPQVSVSITGSNTWAVSSNLTITRKSWACNWIKQTYESGVRWVD